MRKKHTDEAFSLAKITLPKISEVFPRERLFRALDEKKNRPVVWISGPGGSGKTTLVASYLKGKKLPHLWYRMDEGDSDPATFFYYLGMAGSTAAPENPNPMPLLRPEYIQGMPVFALRFFENLFARLKPRALLIFDNYHRIPVQSAFHEAMGKALAAIPEGINVIIISRQNVPKAMIRLQANSAISRIGWKDLRLTQEETAEIVASKQPNIKPEAIRRLHRDADGWIAGIILMLENATSLDITHHKGILSRDEIIDYFGNQFFNRLDSELQRFLLKTAFLPRVTGKMAEALTGLPHSGDLLGRLVKNGYFTERDNSAEPVYRYHQLMREFLKSRARVKMTAAEIETLVAESAHLLEISGAVENAAELRIQAADWEELIRIILTHATGLLGQGRHQVLETWLSAVPSEMLNETPWLLFWKAACLASYQPAEGAKVFEKAFTLFNKQQENAGALLAWSGAVDSILFAWENFTPLPSWLEWLDAHLRDHPEFPSREIEARVIASMAGIFTWALPLRPDVGGQVNRAVRLLPEIGDESLRLQALSNCFTYFFWNGDNENLLPLVEQARAMALSPSATPLSKIAWKIAELRYKLLLSDDYEYCLQLAEEALALGETHGIYIQNNFIYATAAAVALSMNDLDMVENYLKKMAPLAPYTPRAMSNLALYIEGWFHYLRGNPRYAVTLAQKAVDISLECATPIPEILNRQLLAKSLFILGKHEEALLESARIRDVVSGQGNAPMLLYFTLLDEARFRFHQGDKKAALEALRVAMKTGATYNYKTILLHWQPELLAELCAKALENDIETPYVRNLIRSLGLMPEKPPYEIEQWPWPVRIYTLGRFKILCDDVPVAFPRKARKKPLDLLKALLTLGGREVREETIADILWPEAEGDAAHHSFEMTLKRLRDILGYPEAVQLSGGRLTLDDRLCWVDSRAFDRFVKEMKDNTAPESALPAARQAVDIYAGHFLSDELDASYPLSLREQLRAKFLSTIQWLGDQLEISKKWQEAAECYERGLEVDDLAEELYRRLMNCHNHLGRKSEALQVYMRCKNILSTILGIEPSRETIRLYRTISSESPPA